MATLIVFLQTAELDDELWQGHLYYAAFSRRKYIEEERRRTRRSSREKQSFLFSQISYPAALGAFSLPPRVPILIKRLVRK